MATERQPKEVSEILAALHSLSLDTEEEVLTMARDGVRARLQEEGIDPDAGKAEMKRRLQESRGRLRLAVAREQRQAQMASLAQRRPVDLMSFDQIRMEVSHRLNHLSTGPAPTQVYFNRFKNASDDDLPGLLDDLRLLGEMSEEGDSDHG